MSKINGFQIAEEVKVHDFQFDLEVGKTYDYNFEKVRLERIVTTPSFSIKKYLFGLITKVEPTCNFSVVISYAPTGGILGARVTSVPLEKFYQGLMNHHHFVNRLKEVGQNLGFNL